MIDIEWKAGKIVELKVLSRLGGNLRIRTASELAGKGLREAAAENTNPYYMVQDVPQPLISDPSKLGMEPAPETLLYDVDTKPGKTYIFTAK